MHNFYYDFYSHYTCFFYYCSCVFDICSLTTILWTRYVFFGYDLYVHDRCSLKTIIYAKDMFSLITIYMHTACVPWQLVPMFVTCVSTIYIDVHGMRSLISIYIYTCLFWFRSLCAKDVFFNSDILDKQYAVFDFDFYAICMCFWLLFLCTRHVAFITTAHFIWLPFLCYQHVFFGYDLNVQNTYSYIMVSLNTTFILWLQILCTIMCLCLLWSCVLW